MGGQYDQIGNSIARDNQGNVYVTGTFEGTADFDPGPGVYNLTGGSSFFDDIFVLKLDVNQNLVWAKQFGTPNNDDFGCSVVIDPNGDVIVYGHFSSTVDFDPGPGVFNMTSSSTDDIFISKFDSAGNFIWAKQIAGAGQTLATQMVIDQTGNLYCTGYIANTTDFDPGSGTLVPATYGSWDMFAAKYDNSGNVIWAKVMGGPGNDYSTSIAVDNNYNVIITGLFVGTSDFDPGPATYNLTTVAPPAGDIFVAKLDANGDFLWAKGFIAATYVNGAFNTGNHVIADDSNNVYVTGEFRGTVDFDPSSGSYNLTSLSTIEDMFLGKLDSSGNFMWAISIQGLQVERGYCLAIDTMNNVLVSGQQHSDSADYDPTNGIHMEYSTGNANACFLAKYSNTGALICVFLIKYGTTKNGDNQHFLISDNTAYITSGFTNTTDFNPCPPLYILNDLGAYDIYVASYDFTSCNCSMQATSTSTSPQCFGDSTGIATVNIQGGASPYTYAWLPFGGNSASATGLPAGSYTCTIIDNTGDTLTQTFTLTQPSVLTSGITGSNLLCNSVCNGNAQLIVSGGSPGYTYNWSNSQSTANISNLCAGSYSVLITDANGCTSSQSIAITQPTPLVASVSATPTPCNTNGGAVTTSASGGTGTLSYLWQPGGYTTASVSNLAAGIYTVMITDQNGCTQILSDTVASIGAPVTTASGIVDVLCNSDSTGAATVNASGSGPFTYQWSPFGGNNPSANNLTAGIYTVLVTDNQGCTQTQLVSISEPTAIAVSISASNDNCTTGTGSISLATAGGVSPYTYLWSNNQTTAAISGLSGGTFSVTITDGNGCTLDTSASIVSTVAPTLSVASFNDVLCFGDSTGSATVGTNGGTAPFTFAWQPFGSTAASASGLSAGTYSVVVTGADGCSDTITLAINQPPQLLVTCQSSDENCNYQDGSAFVNASGGTGTYNYAWSNSSSGDSISQLSAGTYSVVITDQNGCSETCSVAVNTTATANANAGVDFTMETGQTGALSGSGGVYYSWTPAGDVDCNTCAATTISPTVTTTFVLTVTDSAGCMDYDSIVVFVEIPCDDIFVPNAFSPNGDGQNDFLYVRGTCIESFTFSVYNRWGEKVFQTSDQSVGWDGNWRGVACENAVFTYAVIGYSVSGDPFKVHGNVSLVK